MVFLMNVQPAFFLRTEHAQIVRFLTFRTTAWLVVRLTGTDGTPPCSQEESIPLSFYQVLKFQVPCPTKFEESIILEHQFQEIRLHVR